MAANRRTVLALYPDDKRAALSAPGLRAVIRAFSSIPEVDLDWGWFDTEKREVQVNGRTNLRSYDVVLAGVPFEPLLDNLINALISLGIEPDCAFRGEDETRVIIGGAAPTLNPACAGVIADTVFTGELGAEYQNHELLLELLEKGKKNEIDESINSGLKNDTETGKRQDNTSNIERIIPGAAQRLTPMTGMPVPNAQTVPGYPLPAELIDSSYLDGFDNPTESAFKETGLVEIGRGCGYACRFCAACEIYRPVRVRPIENIVSDIESYKGKATRIGLVGASVSSHPKLEKIIEAAIERGFGVTTSSFRADKLTPKLASLLVEAGMKTITLAPEAGSRRLRKVIGKNLTEKEILNAAKVADISGFKSVRLYFMVGLPWETDEDIDAIISLTGQIRTLFAGRITVSVNSFIPKPNTPFQWCAMADKKRIKKIYTKLDKDLKKLGGVERRFLSQRLAEREALLSLGDAKVGEALIEHIRDGIAWKSALKENDVDVSKIVYTAKPADYIFPWDEIYHIKGKSKIDNRKTQRKTALFHQYKMAENTAKNIE